MYENSFLRYMACYVVKIELHSFHLIMCALNDHELFKVKALSGHFTIVPFEKGIRSIHYKLQAFFD